MIQLTDSVIAVEVPQSAPNDETLYGFHSIYSRLVYKHNKAEYFDETVYEYLTDSKYWQNPYGKGEVQLVGITPLSYETWCTEILSSAYQMGEITHSNDIGLILEEKGFNEDCKYAIIKKEINNMETHNKINMEKKLELKHIHHYLISGDNALKVQFIDPYKEHNSPEVSTIGRVVGLNVWDSSNSKLVSIESDNGRRHCLSLNEIKPILRPLSDLNKPLEDGCIPLFEILKMDYMNIKHADICFIKSDGVYYGDTRLTYLNYKHHEGIQMLPYNTVQKLIKWHFDIFGLIEQGLAIDINKVRNEH